MSDKNPVQKYIPLEITLTNPKRGSKHRAPCMLPLACLDLKTRDEVKAAYGEHLVDALAELLFHKSFRQGIEPRRLIALTDEVAE